VRCCNNCMTMYVHRLLLLFDAFSLGARTGQTSLAEERARLVMRSAGVRELDPPSTSVIIWGLGRSPQQGPRAEPLVRESGELKLKHLAFGRSLKVANLPTLKKCKTQKFRYNLCCLYKKMPSISHNTSQITVQ